MSPVCKSATYLFILHFNVSACTKYMFDNLSNLSAVSDYSKWKPHKDKGFVCEPEAAFHSSGVLSCFKIRYAWLFKLTFDNVIIQTSIIVWILLGCTEQSSLQWCVTWQWIMKRISMIKDMIPFEKSIIGRVRERIAGWQSALLWGSHLFFPLPLQTDAVQVYPTGSADSHAFVIRLYIAFVAIISNTTFQLWPSNPVAVLCNLHQKLLS